MPVLHHRVHVLEVADTAAKMQLMQSPAVQRALVMELDETHWLISGRHIVSIEKACAKAGITMTIQTHGE